MNMQAISREPARRPGEWRQLDRRGFILARARFALTRTCCIVIPGALLCREDAPAARQERIAIEGLGES